MAVQSNLVRPMKCFRNSKLICAVAAVLMIAIGTSVLSEAAGPREFVSELWKKRPRLQGASESKLNPRNWIRRNTGPIGTRRVGDAGWGADNPTDGGADSSTRPDMYQDPFAVSGPVAETADSSTAVTQKSSPAAALSPRQRREAGRRLAVPSGRDDASRNVARRNVAKSTSPVLPDGLQSDSRTPENGSQKSGLDSALLQPEPGNQFAPGFDSEFQRVVQSVIREAETPRPETKPSTRSMAGVDDARRPVVAPLLPDHAKGNQLESLLSVKDVDQLIDCSRRDMTTTMDVSVERQESLQIHSPTEQPQRPVSLADGASSLLSGDQRTILVQNTDAESALPKPGQGQPSLQDGFSTGRSALQRPERLSPLSRSVRPRVVSNEAPPYSVPNNSRHERVSYSSEDELPVVGTVHERLAVDRRENHEMSRSLDGVNSAPEIDWSLDRNSVESGSRIEVPWGFAGIVVASMMVLCAILLLRKRQVITVVKYAPHAVVESE